MSELSELTNAAMRYLVAYETYYGVRDELVAPYFEAQRQFLRAARAYRAGEEKRRQEADKCPK